MSHVRPSGRRLATAATVVLAVAAGLTGVPASAAPVPAAAAQARTTAGAVIGFPAGHKIAGVTASGYLTLDDAKSVQSWVRASDGAVTDLPGSVSVLATGYGDLAAMHSTPSTVELRDLATGQAVFGIRVDPTAGVDYAGAAGRALFSTVTEPSQGLGLRMHTGEGTTVQVTGVPADARQLGVRPATSTHALVTYTAGASRHWGLIDLSTGSVTESGTSAPASGPGATAVSSAYVAWIEAGTGDTPGSVVVRNRATGEVQRTAYKYPDPSYVEIALQGDYLVLGEHLESNPDGLSLRQAPVAYDLKRRKATRLLDHLTSAATSPQGVLYIRGGSVAEGEGLYRFDPGASDGTPTVTLVASTGEPTKLTLVDHNIPEVLDLSRHGGRFDFRWTLSRGNVEGEVTLRHVRTGKTANALIRRTASRDFVYAWSGDLAPWPTSAYNGEYTWKIEVDPLNGVGPYLIETGSFEVTHSTTTPHDLNDNGSPDLLARDESGRLWREDSHYELAYGPHGQMVQSSRTLVGGGWNTYDRVEATGNVGGAATGDLVARDKDGVLWLYLGKGDGTFATRSRIGGGWGGYDQIAAGSDLTNDGRADLVATDKSGVLWLYEGTGDWRAPFASRTRVGEGWDVYNGLTATGDIGGAAAGDLVARDKAGVLWLYLSKGDGTFATRSRIGGGWNACPETVGIGDANHDGRPDLFAYCSDATYFYAGTGDWRAPFADRDITGLLPAYPPPTAVS
ncbi:FG-GAP repeat domain-containing protein [Streptomyces tendae]|uniref:FG-GAP repeat domain-containing protein n=1 Tax=Streptomyces tendae TaxID=1932 RepID=UPI0033FDD5D6